MSVFKTKLVRGDTLPTLLHLGDKSRLLVQAIKQSYIPFPAGPVSSNPQRPNDYTEENDEGWLEYLNKGLPFWLKDKGPSDFTISSGWKKVLSGKVRIILGHDAVLYGVRALESSVNATTPHSHPNSMRTAMDAAQLLSAKSVRMDDASFIATRPSQFMSDTMHKAFTLMYRARRLHARSSYRREMRDDGDKALELKGSNIDFGYGLGLIYVKSDDSNAYAVLSQSEWTHVLRVFGSLCLWNLTSSMYTATNKTLSLAMKNAVTFVMESWGVLGSFAGYVLHKAHSRAVAGFNVGTACSTAQDVENQVNFQSKMPAMAAKALIVYNKFVAMIQSHVNLLGVTDGFTPAAAYRLVPEAPGDHLRAMQNYVTKEIVFTNTDEEVTTAVKDTIRELDAIVLTAFSQRRDAPSPEVKPYALWLQENPTLVGKFADENAYNIAGVQTRARLDQLGKSRFLTVFEASMLTTNGIIPIIDYTNQVKLKAKDRAMVPNDSKLYTDPSKSPKLQDKNKLAYAYLNNPTVDDILNLRDRSYNNPIQGTDIKPEGAKLGDAKRLFYIAQFGVWSEQSEAEESVGESMSPIIGFAIGKSDMEQERQFQDFILTPQFHPWFFCTDIEGFSRNMKGIVNDAKCNRFAEYMNHPTFARNGQYLNDVKIYGRDKLGVYGPVQFKSDLEGQYAKQNTAWHLAVVRRGISKVREYLDKKLGIWAGPAKFMCLIDDGILKLLTKRPLTSIESKHLFDLLYSTYYEVRHKIDYTKAYYGSSVAVFLDKIAINGCYVRNWTKVLGKAATESDVPLQSFDMRVNGVFATAQGMKVAGAPSWMVSNIAIALCLHDLENYMSRGVQPNDGYCLMMPIEWGGYGGMRMATLASHNVTDASVEADALIFQLATSAADTKNAIVGIIQTCACVQAEAPPKERTTLSIIRNIGGISIDIPHIDTSLVTREVQKVMKKVDPTYDVLEHQTLMDEINALDVSNVKSAAAIQAISRLSKLHYLDALVGKVRRARFLLQLLPISIRTKIIARHKADISCITAHFTKHTRLPVLVRSQDNIRDRVTFYEFLSM